MVTPTQKYPEMQTVSAMAFGTYLLRMFSLISIPIPRAFGMQFMPVTTEAVSRIWESLQEICFTSLGFPMMAWQAIRPYTSSVKLSPCTSQASDMAQASLRMAQGQQGL